MTDRNWESGNTKGSTLEEILAGLCLLGMVVSFIMLVGTAGAIDCDTITMADGIKRVAVWLIVFICSAIGILHVEKEEDIYERL